MQYIGPFAMVGRKPNKILLNAAPSLREAYTYTSCIPMNTQIQIEWKLPLRKALQLSEWGPTGYILNEIF